MFRIAQPGEFTFKRDCDGRETVEHGGLVFATMDGPDHIEFISMRKGLELIENGHAAMAKARQRGFWNLGTPTHGQSPVVCTVKV